MTVLFSPGPHDTEQAFTVKASSGAAFLRPRLEAALAEGGGMHTWPEVVERIAAGRAQLWLTEDDRGAIVTEILTYPRTRIVNYWLVAGAMDACLAKQRDIDAWARGQGCSGATAMGRGGWRRVLPEHGWRIAGTAYKKAFEP